MFSGVPGRRCDVGKPGAVVPHVVEVDGPDGGSPVVLLGGADATVLRWPASLLQALHRAGLREVIMPAGNQKDLRDVPDEVRQNMAFTFVATMDEVMRLALLPSAAGLVVLLNANLMVPLALPLGILLASIMTFGNMGEAFELV